MLGQTVRDLDLGPSARVLDAGCGTGKTLSALEAAVAARGYGLDMAPGAAAFWPRRGLSRMCLASVNDIPFRDGAFDTALGIDVLESEDVDERRAYAELWRVVREGGYLVLVVPAYRWLFSPEHHRAVHASRRYTRRDLAAVLRVAPVRVVRMTSLYMSSLLPAALYRFWLRHRRPGTAPRSELRRLPWVIDEALFRAVDAERRLLRRFDLPFGSSILAVVQKTATS